MNKIIIQTALLLEQQAILSKLSNVTDYIHPTSKTIYKVGNYVSNNQTLKIIVGRTNQTNINAGIETERIIEHFKPNYIFFVGVAGGLKDVSIGDVVIGSDVYGYERGKTKNEFLPRPQFGFSSYELEQLASSFSMSTAWKNQSSKFVESKFHDKVSVLIGTIASGEKVIGSTKSEIYAFMKKNCSHALAVEMEGLGFLEACRQHPALKSLLVRGISDLVDGKEDADNEGSQDYASLTATEFLFGMIDFMKIDSVIKIPTKNENLIEIVTKLYPSGLKENQIWLRSGGDLSLVNLQSNGKTQWIEALMLLKNGGGGDIDMKTLIAEIKKDFKNNEDVAKL
jgi:nucleoside phosphorylase